MLDVKFKVAVIGCGRISKKHLGLITEQFCNDLKLVAICDIDQHKLAVAGQRYKCPTFSSIQEMLYVSKPDIVVILSESGNHGEHIRISATFPIKAIICEKPLCLKLEEAKHAIALCAEKNIELFLVKQNRLNPPIVKLFEALENGRLGKLVLGSIRVRWCRTQEYYDQASWRGTWELDGGALANQASHHVDLLLEAMGPAVSVMAYSQTMLAEIEAEDTLVAIVQFKNGAMGTIEITTATRPKDLEGSISVLGSSGVVEVGGFAVNKIKTWEVVNEPLNNNDLSRLNEDPPDVYGYSHYRYYKNAIHDLRGATSVATRGRDGLKSLDLIHAIYQSTVTGQEVLIGTNYKASLLGHPLILKNGI
ncbi:Gfo/Idh/MocA family oxidoreductase [bacterium]|nr:Gfo/Idh/MocA family oxidoreductase [bacterium]